MITKPVNWEGSTDFESYVIRLFQANKTNTEEFQRLLRLKGRERMEAIWKKYKSGDYVLRDSRDEKKDQPKPSEHKPETKASSSKAKSYVERSCPDDDL